MIDRKEYALNIHLHIRFKHFCYSIKKGNSSHEDCSISAQQIDFSKVSQI